MEFRVANCAVISMKRGKRVRSEGIKLPSDEEMKEPDANGYKYLGVLELDSILFSEMKSKVKNTYLKRLTLLLKSKWQELIFSYQYMGCSCCAVQCSIH